MQVPENAQRIGITIQGVPNIQVPLVFDDNSFQNGTQTWSGQIAAVLNQTLHENLRNNCAAAIAKLKEAAGDGEVNFAEVQEHVDKYLESYDFGVRRGGSRKPADPIEAIALELADEQVRDALKSEGYTLKEVGSARIAEMAAEAVEKHPEFRKEAERTFKQRQKSLKVNLSELGGVNEAE